MQFCPQTRMARPTHVSSRAYTEPAPYTHASSALTSHNAHPPTWPFNTYATKSGTVLHRRRVYIFQASPVEFFC